MRSRLTLTNSKNKQLRESVLLFQSLLAIREEKSCISLIIQMHPFPTSQHRQCEWEKSKWCQHKNSEWVCYGAPGNIDGPWLIIQHRWEVAMKDRGLLVGGRGEVAPNCRLQHLWTLEILSSDDLKQKYIACLVLQSYTLYRRCCVFSVCISFVLAHAAPPNSSL